MKKWMKKNGELICFALGLFFISCINRNEVYIAFIIILLLYFYIKNHSKDK